MSRLQVTYLVSASARDIERRAEAIAVEQSIEMPPTAVREQRIFDEVPRGDRPCRGDRRR
jgi:ribulose-bisphosphate carboxylase large chain